MKEMLSKKRIVFVVTMILLVIVTGLYATYAINVYYNEGTPTTYDQALDFSLSGVLDTELVVEAGKTKVFDMEVSNPYEGAVKYGIAYKMVSPTTLPDGVTIARPTTSEAPTIGLIEASSSVNPSVIVVNNSNSDLTVIFSIINGYKNGGELILEDGQTLVSEIYYFSTPTNATETLNALSLTLGEGTPDFTKTSCSSGCEEATVGLYEYEDDLGTSYYFRGDVQNNYVKFGKWSEDTPDVVYMLIPNGPNEIVYSNLEECQEDASDGMTCQLASNAGKDMYWRIIRINGDGTIRMIYEGTQAWKNGITSDLSAINKRVGISYFNSSWNDNAYVGYMYGQTGVTATGTEGYNLTHSNDNNSTIKTYLEGELTSNNTGWYYENILATGYHDYIADAIYCNDRSLDTTNSSYTGIGKTSTNYRAYQSFAYDTSNVLPNLMCINANDRFTISTSTLAPTDGLGTNKKLKYPVGLVTADEVVLAGGKYNANNSKFYLYSSKYFWTMTPNNVTTSGGLFKAHMFAFTHINFLYKDVGNMTFGDSGIGVRPVISLKADAIKYGTGIIGDEFRITQ